jgi:hypothetical protein
MRNITTIEFPLISSRYSLVCEDFFFEKYVNNRVPSTMKNLIKCKVKIGSKFLRPLFGEIFNVSDCVLEILHTGKTNIFNKISCVHMIGKKIKFRNFIDFEFSAGINSNFFYNKIKNSNLKTKKKNPILYTLPVDIIPPFFLSKIRNTSLSPASLYNQIKETYTSDPMKTYKESTFMKILSMDKRSKLKKKEVLEVIIDFRMDRSPQIGEKKKQLMFIPSFAIGFFTKIFKKRPIWTRKRLETFLPLSLKRYARKILPVMSYRFSGINPFKKGWIRNGFDPRKVKKSCIYQSFGIHPRKNSTKTQSIRSDLIKGGIFMINSDGASKSFIGQFCDVKNVRIKAFLRKKKKGVYYIHYITGWYSFPEISQIQSLFE